MGFGEDFALTLVLVWHNGFSGHSIAYYSCTQSLALAAETVHGIWWWCFRKQRWKYPENFPASYKSLSSLNHQDFDKIMGEVLSLSRLREERSQEERCCQIDTDYLRTVMGKQPCVAACAHWMDGDGASS